MYAYEVGAGSAGSVVTFKLSENPTNQVLVLEGGGDPNPLTSIPFLILYVRGQPSLDYIYKTVPQNNSSFISTDGVGKKLNLIPM